MVVSSVISWLTSAAMKLNAITKNCKYKRFYEEHFIPIVMEMHSVPGRDMDHFIMEVPIFSMIDDKRSFILVFLLSIFQAIC